MEGLAVRLNDVMSAVGGQSVVEIAEEDEFKAGDYGYRYLVRVRRKEGGLGCINTILGDT